MIAARWVQWRCLLLFAASLGCESAPTSQLGARVGPVPADDADAGGSLLRDAGDLDAAASIAARGDGEPCTTDAECRGGRCMPEPGFPGGYCTFVGCRSDAQCVDSISECVRRAGPDICAHDCRGPRDCRAGYGCFSVAGSGTVCLPEGERPTPALRPDGEPCELDSECSGGTCYADPEWPDGHCTTRFCASDSACSAPARGRAECLYQGLRIETFCAMACLVDADCRGGYGCMPVDAGTRACLPEQGTGVGDAASFPFAMTCGLSSPDGTVAIDFRVSPGTRAYAITALTRDGAFLLPREIRMPSGGRIDFSGDNAFQTVTTQLAGWVAPIVFPAVPQDERRLESGVHRLLVDTDSVDLCWYLIEEPTRGGRVDINFYFVGTDGLDASSAGADPHFTAMLQALDRVLSGAALSLGRVRFFDVTGPNVDRFSVIRQEGDIARAAALARAPGDDLDAALSANIIMVRTIAIGALGVSTGIPGPPGLHGTKASGVVVTSELLGATFSSPSTGQPLDGDDFTATVIAHELGHFLGLFHTTEGDLVGSDPLSDTPICTPDLFPDRCPDRQNLMFPFDPGSTISEGQAFTLGTHPLSKE